MRRDWDRESLTGDIKGNGNIIFLSWVVGPYISCIMSHIMIIGHLQHEKGIKNSTVCCSYFCNAKLPNIRRH